MFFKGGVVPSRPSTNPTSITSLAGTPLAPLQPHAQDIILFKGMSIHGGSPKTDGYQEEHAAGPASAASTGNSYHYSKNDSYYAYTDFESIDIAIANHYKTVPALAALPFASLHIGAGAHSDADNVGLGQRYISYREAPGGRLAVRQRDRADPGRRAGLRHADAAREPALLDGLATSPATDRPQAARGARRARRA